MEEREIRTIYPATVAGEEQQRKILQVEEYESPDDLYKGLIERVQKYHPSDDVTLIEKAYDIAENAHRGQVRKSGQPYIIHPLCVAIGLADLEMDKETIVAGLLHDVVEDTILTDAEIRALFGDDVAELVDGVTKLQHFQYSHQPSDRLDIQAENLRKMFLAMAKDIRVIIIKLVDRLHNMRTLKHMTPESQKRIARETLDIYAPIAQRLGISKIKVELDDLSLKYLEPEVYYDLVEKISLRKSARERYVQEIVEEVMLHMQNAGIEAQVDGRVKHFFSIYKKMVNQNKTLDQIHDLFAVRIIVNSVRDCYAALGVIHELYIPVPGRFKDYIAMPKPNRYQSLHSTLMGADGREFEIQIRTMQMHKTAEYGIAAHWKYKETADGKRVNTSEEEKMSWLRQVLEWQKDMSNKEFVDTLLDDFNIFSDNVYCFTPSGEAKNLPAGSTPIDFAYSIHSAVGNKMIGARVNGRLVTIDYKLSNGDSVEIITSQNSKGPSRDWLGIVKSSQAKSKINQWFKNEYKEDNITRGKEQLAAYCKVKGISAPEIMRPEYMEIILNKFGFHDWDSVLAAVGHGGLKEGQIINRMLEQYDKDHRKKMTDQQIMDEIAETAKSKPVAVKSKSGIVVKGIHDVAVRFSKCCNPLPGDEIVGFVTRGRGVSIHRTDCINVISMNEMDRVRLIDAEWQEGTDGKREHYLAEIVIYSHNRNGLLADISRVLTERNIDIRSLNTRISKQGTVSMEITFEISGKDELQKTIDKLSNVESVMDIERTSG